MILQFEITTRCNFDCFYCAGRTMRQGDMSYDAFVGLLNAHIARSGVPALVSLQGEGEPTLHRDFLKMAELVRKAGSVPYTITNGTYKHPERLVGVFQRIGVSIDALDEAAASAIGRYNLRRVLAFVEQLTPHVEIVVHSVAHQVYTPPVVAWCRAKGLRHVVQPLQGKPDYSRRYLPAQEVHAPERQFKCVYLERPRMRYYSLDGVEMPCCFIKDTSTFEGIPNMIRHHERGTWPRSCIGCHMTGTCAPSSAPDSTGRVVVGNLTSTPSVV